MRAPSIVYAVFCVGVVVLFTFTAARGSSPFANGGARSFVGVAHGPNHK